MKRVKSTGIHTVRGPDRHGEGTEPDWAAVELVLSGRPVKLFPNELCMAIWILKRQGTKHIVIAERLGCNVKTVQRHANRCKPDKCETYSSRRRRHDQSP